MDSARSRIKKAFVSLLADHEFSKLSVTDICRQADMLDHVLSTDLFPE